MAAAAELPGSVVALQVPHADRLSVAPMMEWTDRNYRFLARLLSRHTKLYTEMVVDSTLVHAPLARGYLRMLPVERPVACQLGGSTPELLARCAVMVAEAGYDEINLNCGCPSARVAGNGEFGARLMFDPVRVRDCVAAMAAVVALPITVKCRLGADGMDSYTDFARFLHIVSQGGCNHFIVHARKCLLAGLSPKDNRSVPPLRYYWVQRAALEFPHLRISINGGIETLDQTVRLLSLRQAAAYVRPAAFDWQLPPANPPVALDAGVAVPDTTGGAPACCAPDNDDEGDGGEDENEDADGGDAPAAAGDGVTAAGTKRPRSAGSCSSVPPEGAPALTESAIRRARRKLARKTRPRISGAAARAMAIGPGTEGHPSNAHEQIEPGVELPAEPVPIALFGTRPLLLDSVMIGRAAYTNPWMLADADRRVFGVPNRGLSRREVVLAYCDYAETVASTVPPEELRLHYYKCPDMMKPLHNFFHGCAGNGKYRQVLQVMCGSNALPLSAFRPGVMAAIAHIPDEVLDERPPV